MLIRNKSILLWLLFSYFLYDGLVPLMWSLLSLGRMPLSLVLPTVCLSSISVMAAVGLLLRMAICRYCFLILLGFNLVSGVAGIFSSPSLSLELDAYQWFSVLTNITWQVVAVIYSFYLDKTGYYKRKQFSDGLK